MEKLKLARYLERRLLRVFHNAVGRVYARHESIAEASAVAAVFSKENFFAEYDVHSNVAHQDIDRAST